ncbi:MAG: response regulator [Treponema sp.]|nr:MAG: response regulator [Treponema sp.]HPX47022.1 response regulator [Treponemataceae bacterium]HQL33884.1 response regulator [Treponemataceae bacterium]
MKQVLLIDQTAVFRDYLLEKLEDAHVSVLQGLGKIDSISKMRSDVPDLVVIDFGTARDFIFDLLEAKKADPNAKDIPVIVLTQMIDTRGALRLASMGIKHIIPKPVKVDYFFATVKNCMNVDIEIDETPCILEARVNDTIIFIEIAQGLNREKIKLLRYKITELIDLYDPPSPKILVLMSDLSLSFIDGPNLELLMNGLTTDRRVRNRNIKLLTLDPFIRQFVAGNKAYAEIQVLTDLSKAIDTLVRNTDDQEKTDIISEKILSLDDGEKKAGSLEMRFKSEIEVLKSAAADYRIAVVDDDITIRTILTKTFSTIKANVDAYESGIRFLEAASDKQWNLIFLDLMMPNMNGFEVLMKLHEKHIATPVIVLSAVSQREAVLKVLSAGVKSYMIKPLKPDSILKKTIEVLNGGF